MGFLKRVLLPGLALLSLCLYTRGMVQPVTAQPSAGLDNQSSISVLFKSFIKNRIDKIQVTQAISGLNRAPASATTQPDETVNIEDVEYKIQYTLDPVLQKTIEDIYKRSGAQYGAFVAMDPTTGKILAIVSHGKSQENLALKATFPSASVFKIVTAAAAIETGKLTHQSLIPVTGSYHTLYRSNIFRSGGIDPSHTPRYARLISFADAMAKSVNSVFGKIGIFGVGHEGISKTASNFAFNKDIPFEWTTQTSRAQIPTDPFGVAESASGFTKNNTMSPLHGAMIASAVINDGVIMEPSVVESLVSAEGNVAYSFQPTAFVTATDKRTAHELKLMLSKTITNGTSRGSFRGFQRTSSLGDAFIGGKTGTLDGWDPPGRYDWFVGFAENHGKKIAVSALCIHGPWRGMKASKVARSAFEAFFKNQIAKRD